MSLNLSLQALDSDLFSAEYFLQDDVCRLCWNKNAYRNISQELSEDEATNNELAEKIQECLNIDLSQKSYPNKVCNNCSLQIENFHEFKIFCKETDRRLQNIAKIQIEELTCDVKLEKLQDLSTIELELGKTESFDGFLDTLQSDNEEIVTEKKGKLKNKYKPKRCPTFCNICLVDYENKETFIKHNIESHGVEDNGETFKCFGCEKRFKSRKTRLGHELNFCKGLKDGYKCPLCERYLPKRRTYEAHMRDHRNNVTVKLPEDIFKCKKCFELFKTKESLKKHAAVHETDKKNFVCEVRVFFIVFYVNSKIRFPKNFYSGVQF